MSRIISIDFPKDSTWYQPLPTYPRDTSGWWGLPDIMPALLNRFNIERKSAIEFGCEYCYSTACFAQLFNQVIGVDHWVGDGHSGHRENYSHIAINNIKPWPNVKLFQSSYQDWIKIDLNHYNLCHVDVVHTYEATYELALWGARHADITICHDTNFIWSEPKAAISQVADETGLKFYDYVPSNGLGILVRE